MDVSFDGISDEDLALIWKNLRDRVEDANEKADEVEREANHLAFMAVIAEQGKRTEAWIAGRKVDE